MNHWAGWSADDWVRHYSGPHGMHAAGAIPLVAPQVQVLAYRNMWSPYVSQVVAAANQCADTYDKSPDPAMKALAGPFRIDGMALQTQWNNAGDLRFVLHPSATLQESQDIVLTRCNQVLELVRKRCPDIQIPLKAPSPGLQAQVIGVLEHAKIIGMGVLHTFKVTLDGYLDRADKLAHEALQAASEAAREPRRVTEGIEKTVLWVGAGVLGVIALVSLGGRRGS